MQDASQTTPGLRMLLPSVFLFVVVLAIGMAFVKLFEDRRLAEMHSAVNTIGSTVAHSIERQLNRSLSSTFALASLIRQHQTMIADFDAIAAGMLERYEGIDNLQLAPRGVVSQIYPLAGNEQAIGHDLLKDPARRVEASAAIESKRLTLAGPFTLVQGGVAVIGRLPVFIPDRNGKEHFWGFTIALIRFSALLEAIKLQRLVEHGYDYELARRHPDTGERHIFARSAEMGLQNSIPFDIQVPNGTWTLSIASQEGWQSSWLQVAEVALVTLISALVSVLFYNVRLRATDREQATEALRRRAERLRVLRDMDQAILASRSPETIAQAALGHIRRLVLCHRTSVTLFDFETDVLTVLAADVSGESRVVAGARFPLGAIPDIEAIRQGKVRIVDDILGLPELSPLLQILKGEGLRCYVATPLVSQGEVIGALNLGADHPGAFVPEHVDIAGEVADSVAVAIQNARLFEQVHATSERLQNLARQLVEVQESERRHIARELHDEIGQVLTGLKLTLEMNTRLSNEGLAEAKALANDLIGKVRELSLSLRPAMLDDFGLLAALLWHFERYTIRTHVHVTFQHSGLDGRRFQPEVETTAYRIVQEALTNVARHAGVSEVTVRVWTDQITLHVQIQDHGTGFPPEAVEASRGGGGLGGMQERAALLNGCLTLESAAGSGTRLMAELPLGEREEKGKRESGTGDGQDHNSAGG